MIEVVVTDRQPVAERVVAFTLAAVDGRPLPAWLPGAHIDLVLAPGLVRPYSLCGDPADRRAWRIAVLREPFGKDSASAPLGGTPDRIQAAGRGGSALIHDRLRPGDRLSVCGPRNLFPLRPAPAYLFIAGGIGITPILPMVAEADRAGAEFRLVYGGRHRAGMAFLDSLGQYGERVIVWPQDECGLIDLAGLLDRPSAGTLVYCCGPEPLLAAVEERCRTWPEGALHIERFTPAAALGGDGFEVVLRRSGRTLRVPADRSILHVVEEAGLSVLSSCREGTCGTCETAVLDGEPDHRDSVLSEAERAAGDIMMICVSRARGTRLVLDL